MKTLMLGLILLGFAGGALAIDSAELDARIQNLTALFQAMQDKPDVAVPPEVLHDAKALILLDLTKAGLGFAYQHGAGVALVKDPATGKWSAPGFIEANTASVGPQAGGEQTFCVIALMSTNSTYALTQKNFAPGGEAGATAGYTGGSVQSSASRVAQDAKFYADRNGFFGGADVKFGGISPDENANTVYYEKAVTMSDILFNHATTRSPAAQELTRAIQDHSKVAKASESSGN
jgi:lipid-binding SYLF domain-containing protein